MATIFYFSSTGNSLHAAKRIAEALDGKVLPMSNEATTCSDDMIGFVFPVYFWRAPRMVEQFAAQLQITSKEVYKFAIVTHGGNELGALAHLGQILNARGKTLHYGAQLRAVSNYTAHHEIDDSEDMQVQFDTELSEAIKEIQDWETNHIPRRTILSKIGGSFFPRENSDLFFTVSESCTGCKTCQKVCPAQNISAADNKVRFHQKCEHCFGCLHNCPQAAINWKSKTSGRKRYRHPDISLKEMAIFDRS